MTVQELVNLLLAIENKESIVIAQSCQMCYHPVIGIFECRDGLILQIDEKQQS